MTIGHSPYLGIAPYTEAVDTLAVAEKGVTVGKKTALHFRDKTLPNCEYNNIVLFEHV